MRYVSLDLRPVVVTVLLFVVTFQVCNAKKIMFAVLCSILWQCIGVCLFNWWIFLEIVFRYSLM